jgi:hypothetical protein
MCGSVCVLLLLPTVACVQRNPDSSASSEIPCCAFSADGKYVAYQLCDGPSSAWTVSVWNWSAGKLICSSLVPTALTKLTFNPLDSTQLCGSGPSVFRLWRVLGNELTAFPPFAGIRSVEVCVCLCAIYVVRLCSLFFLFVYLRDFCLMSGCCVRLCKIIAGLRMTASLR